MSAEHSRIILPIRYGPHEGGTYGGFASGETYESVNDRSTEFYLEESGGIKFKKVLDVATGTGVGLDKLFSSGALEQDAQAVGLDNDHAQLKDAATFLSNYPNVKLIYGKAEDIRALTRKLGPFDIVTINNALHLTNVPAVV